MDEERPGQGRVGNSAAADRGEGAASEGRLAQGAALWDAFSVIDYRFFHLSPPKATYGLAIGIFVVILLAWPVLGTGQDAESETAGWRGGFAQPVPVIPEIGLWADAMSELGYGARPGLLLWWGLEPGNGDVGADAVDWAKYTFRVRVEILDEDGDRVAKGEELIDPLHKDDLAARGGFPTSEHLVIDRPGKYRARLEAYPLMTAEEAGLDSVPRGMVEVDVVVAERSLSNDARWLISDLLFLDTLENWLPGSHSERTWYEWVIYPNVPRSYAADSSGALVAFEIERGEELVDRCNRRNCRVVISVLDGSGGIIEHVMRQVPKEGSVSAYVVPIQTVGLEPGNYLAQVEVFEGGDKIVSVSRPFGIRKSELTEVVQEEDAPTPASVTGP